MKEILRLLHGNCPVAISTVLTQIGQCDLNQRFRRAVLLALVCKKHSAPSPVAVQTDGHGYEGVFSCRHA